MRPVLTILVLTLFAPLALAQQTLRELLDEHVAWVERENPVAASMRGNDAFAGLLRDESAEAHTRRRTAMADRLARLDGLTNLSERERVDRDLLAYELRQALDMGRFYPEQMPLDRLSGPHITLPQLCEMTPLLTNEQRVGYVERLEAIPLHLEHITQQLRDGMRAGRTPPRVVLSGTLAGVRGLCGPDVKETPEISPFFRPFAGRPVEGDALATRAREAIATRVLPAFEAFGVFLEREYLPACRTTTGASEGVDGRAYYDACLRDHTTTNLTAEEIHAIGLREVASLRAQMLASIHETGFANNRPAGEDDDALFAAFLAHTRGEERFRWKTSEEMLVDYRELAKRIDAELPALFATLPRNPYGVRPISAFAAKSSPSAYYYPGNVKTGVAGYFMVNTSDLSIRPRFARISLTIHEAMPGHHLQGTLAQELAASGTQHPFRSMLGCTAFVEGWGLYSERLGLEMGENKGSALEPEGPRRGLYSDPYDNFGRLSDEIWRACRLVVDTGLHAFGWTRQQAIDYLLTNTAISSIDAASEVDRYIGWPGQACAYKIGQLEILELRRLAQERLGERFDVRQFHDRVLENGAVPLPVLRAHIESWMEQSRMDQRAAEGQ